MLKRRWKREEKKWKTDIDLGWRRKWEHWWIKIILRDEKDDIVGLMDERIEARKRVVWIWKFYKLKYWNWK